MAGDKLTLQVEGYLKNFKTLLPISELLAITKKQIGTSTNNELASIRFSNNLTDITINEDDDIFISDAGCGEIVIIRNIHHAKSRGFFYIIKLTALTIAY